MEIFKELPLGIQELIFNNVIEIQNKKYFSGYVLGELKYYNKYERDLKNNLRNIYSFYDCGIRETIDYQVEMTDGSFQDIVETETYYDEIYYNNLDYLFLCDIFCDIDMDNKNISFGYIVKDHYKHITKSIIEENEPEEIEDCWEFCYVENGGKTYDLIDFIDEYMLDNNEEEEPEELFELMDDNFNNMTEEEFRTLINKTFKNILFKNYLS